MLDFSYVISENANSKSNYGIARVGTKTALILDASAGDGKKSYTKTGNDAKWLINKLSIEFTRLEGVNDLSVDSVVEEAALKLRNEFYSIAKEKYVPKYSMPSAQICMVRWKEEDHTIEYFVMGDAKVIMLSHGTVFKTSDSNHNGLEDKINEKMSKLMQKKGLNHAEAMKMVESDIRFERSMMNNPKGYWAFSFDDGMALNSQAAKGMEIGGNTAVIIASSSFCNSVEKSGIYKSWYDLYNEAWVMGPESIVKTIRSFENQDPECVKLPRKEKHSSMFAIILNFKGK